MRDADEMSKAILDIELILSEYLEPGPRDSDRIIAAIIERLDRDDIIAIAERVQAGNLRSPYERQPTDDRLR